MENLTIQQVGILIAMVSVTAITVVGLLAVVLVQNRRIQQLQTPKYGFLGKPLAIILFVGFSVGGLGILYNTFGIVQPPDISVGDEDLLLMEIDVSIINERGNLYRFNAVPSINGVKWGTEGATFDIEWEFENRSKVYRSETNLSTEFGGGVVFTMQSGTTKITAKSSYKGRLFSRSIDILIE